ncbi:hypothetical protein, partial [Bradyrhizobium genomosp. III]|uniref:hypothetical protein n=1 Tax=Bradyrhizobium genomosp. III TaxID=2683271 RepID=UPI001AEBBA75
CEIVAHDPLKSALTIPRNAHHNPTGDNRLPQCQDGTIRHGVTNRRQAFIVDTGAWLRACCRDT